MSVPLARPRCWTRRCLFFVLTATSSAHELWWVPAELPSPTASATVPSCGPGPDPNSHRPEKLPRPNECSEALDPEALGACNLSLSPLAAEGELLLLAASGNHLEDLEPRLTAARTVASRQLLLVVTDERARERAAALGVAWWFLPAEPARLPARHWAAAALLLRNGVSLVLSSPRVHWLASPFAHLSRDVDVEAAQTSGSYERGTVEGVHDPPMGWSAYGQTMAQPLLDPTVVALQATAPASELAAAFGALLGGAAAAADEAWASWSFSALVIQPAHDALSRAGVSFKLLRPDCFLGSAETANRPSAVSVRAAPPAASEAARAAAEVAIPSSEGSANAILTSATFDSARATALDHGCAARAAVPPVAGAAAPRAPNWVLPASEAFPGPASACEADENSRALCHMLREYAIGREVLAAVSNKNILPMLELFVEGTRRANISNTMVVALDDTTHKFVSQKLGRPSYLRQLISRTGSTDNHATSGLKFAVLREFLEVGCSVLLSDVDVLWLQNPFTLPSLYRDSDVEGMTDGWDDLTAYGFRWLSTSRRSSWNPFGRPAPPMPQMRLSARNSGLFYLRATKEALRMMIKLKRRMETEGVWDQTAYNEEMWYAARSGEHAHGISVRVMPYLCHMNSKSLFRFMLNDAELMRRHRPVSVHINYHPEKLPRMQDVFERYYGLGPNLGSGAGQPTARSRDGGLEAWHWGVGLKSGRWCREKPRRRAGEGIGDSRLAQRVLSAAGPHKWAGISGIGFQRNGVFDTPWGPGKWGLLQGEPETLFVDFMGQQHLANSTNDVSKLLSIRCADLERVTITLVGMPKDAL